MFNKIVTDLVTKQGREEAFAEKREADFYERMHRTRGFFVLHREKQQPRIMGLNPHDAAALNYIKVKP